MGNRELSFDEKAELAATAKAMLAPGSVFNKIVTALVSEAVTELASAPLYDLTARQAHARMKSLEDIKVRLQIFINDVTMASKGQIK